MWPFKTKAKETIKSNTIVPLDKPLPPYITKVYTREQTTKKFNTNALMLLYETVSQVNSVVNYVAIKAADIPIKHVKYLGNGKTKDMGETEYLKSLNSPNKGVSMNSFIEDIVLQYVIQGNAPVKIIRTPGFVAPTSYDVWNAATLYKIPQYSIDQYGTPSMAKDVRDNPVLYYKNELQNGYLQRMELEDFIYIKDKNPRKIGIDYYYGASRLYAATQSITILKNLYETINTILAAKGALGFLKRTTRNGEIDPMQWKDTVEAIEQRINEDYGTTGGRKSIMATYADMDWVRMDSPVNEFLPIELTQQEFAQLCNQIGGVPDVLFNSKGTSTYNNVVELKKAFYENTIKPLLNNIYNTISIGLGINVKNEWIVADYSGIPELNETPLDKIKYYYDSKMITKNEALMLGGLPESTDPSFNDIENGIQTQSTGTSDT